MIHNSKELLAIGVVIERKVAIASRSPVPDATVSEPAWQALPYSTPQELVAAFKSGTKFVLHYHDSTFNVTSMEARERVVYVWPPVLPVKVWPDGSSAEGDSGVIWLAAPPTRRERRGGLGKRCCD